MNITIQTFAFLKDKFGKEFELDIPENSKVQDVLNILAQKKPDTEGVLNSCMVAINDEMVDRVTIIRNGQSVLIMPPASGG